MKFDLNVKSLEFSTTGTVQYVGIPAADLQEAVIEFCKRRKMLMITSPNMRETWYGIAVDETGWSDADLQEYVASIEEHLKSRNKLPQPKNCSYKGLYEITEATVFKW